MAELFIASFAGILSIVNFTILCCIHYNLSHGWYRFRPAPQQGGRDG